MFLKEVRVNNFRSLRDVNVKLDESTILIGENNAGKSDPSYIVVGKNKSRCFK